MKLEEVILLKDLGVMSPNVESNYKIRYGLYKCFCGNEFKVQTRAIKSGNTKSCGCLRKNTAKELNSIHNLSKHRLFHIRNNMIQRCNNKNHPKYKDYGERNIKVCNEWLNDFMSFYNWSIDSGLLQSFEIDEAYFVEKYSVPILSKKKNDTTKKQGANELLAMHDELTKLYFKDDCCHE